MIMLVTVQYLQRGQQSPLEEDGRFDFVIPQDDRKETDFDTLQSTYTLHIEILFFIKITLHDGRNWC